MRLLRHAANDELELVNFETDDIPPYAILSHTWSQGEEVSLQELIAGTGKNKPGYQKIRFCGELAARDKIEFFWVDTCCIDKTSSAELQEAINSMFKWYERAVVCYVYLSDVTDATSIHGEGSQFFKSRWHSRGWTLQELLAPRDVQFYARDGSYIGTKLGLAAELSAITRIEADILRCETSIHTASVAARMSWASLRMTSRTEDLAYCLMGIFSVNMTMLYGEGAKAFLRLQEAICLGEWFDDSIFAWQNLGRVKPSDGFGLLADHPRHFQHAWQIVRRDTYYMLRGLPQSVQHYIEVRRMLLSLDGTIGTYLLLLDCILFNPDRSALGYLALVVCKMRGLDRAEYLVRLHTDTLIWTQCYPNMFVQQILLAKTGRSELMGYRWVNAPVLPRCDYYLATDTRSVRSTGIRELSCMYSITGDQAHWEKLAWIARCEIVEPLQIAGERRTIGDISFHNQNGISHTFRLGVVRKIDVDKFFSMEVTRYHGQVCLIDDGGLERLWGASGHKLQWTDGPEIRVQCEEVGSAEWQQQKIRSESLRFVFIFLIRE